MAAYDGALSSLMQGVSQQVPQERLDGQVSMQVNMLSDPVRGMRRRPGARLVARDLFNSGNWSREGIFVTPVEIDDNTVHVLVNTADGTIVVYDENFQNTLHLDVQGYLAASSAQSLQAVMLRGYLYICNTERKPTKVVSNTGLQDPTHSGYYYVRASLYSKQYSVTITLNGTPYTASYTVPNGSNTGDADKATPEYIAGQILQSFAAMNLPSISLIQLGGYVYANSNQTLAITSDSGTTYMGASGSARVTQVSDLPARLPSQAAGMMMSVGANDKNAVWYKYDTTKSSWVEVGAYGSASALQNMPIRMKLDSTYAVSAVDYEGRNAGTDDTNEDPPFLDEGITGMGAFQGRLVLLAGPQVSMSAAGKPLRFYRSTVSEVLSSDPISIYSGAATSTSFTHCVQFNKDLLLFSKTCQAVVPAGQAAITPSTAQIVITSGYSATTLCPPIVAGRSVLYFAPRSATYASALELVPSTTTDSQYTTNDVTAHLPKYMPGTIRLATASTTSNSLVLVASGDPRTVFVQDYLWGGEEKVQSAWHTWSLPYDVVCTWFVRDKVYLGLAIGSTIAVVTIEPAAGDTIDGLQRPFSDLYIPLSVVSRTFTVPAYLRTAVLAGEELLLTQSTGNLAGEWVGITSVDTTTWQATTVLDVDDGTYMLGLRYRSALSPTPPLMRDQNKIVIGTSQAILIRWEARMGNAGEFEVIVQRNTEILTNGTYSGVLWESSALAPNRALNGERGRVVVPVRALSTDAVTTFQTDGEHDMGILTLEYVMQYHGLRRRA